MHFATTILMLPAMALALKVTAPAKDSTWDSSNGQTVEFDAVSTDPREVNIVLVNMAVNPSVSITIAENVDTAPGSYEIPADKLAGLTTDRGYQINLVSPDNNGILAQSGTFEVEESESPSPTTSSASDASTSSASITGTETTVSGSRTMTNTLATSTHTGTHSQTGTASESASATESSGAPTTTPNAAAFNSVGMGGAIAAVLAGLAALL